MKTFPSPPPRCRAWLGQAEHFPEPTVKICSWCPDAAQAELAAQQEGVAITHSICVFHYQQQIAALTGENPND